MLAITTATYGQSQLPNDPEVRTGKLENGLKYYIRHNGIPAQRAEFWLATDAGSFQEEDHQDGLAHFYEHMCFNGTKNFPGTSMIDYLRSIGAEYGTNINAATGFEETEYMLNNIPIVRESIIDSCLLILHDWSGYVTLDPEMIDKERNVIIEEKRQDDTADERMYLASLPYYYGDTPYSRRSILGTYDQLANFEHKSLIEFSKQWYRPDNQAVIIVGDIDVDVVEAKVKEMFSSIPVPAEPLQKSRITIAGNTEPIIGIITDPEASDSYFEILWKHEPLPEELNSTDVGYMNDLIDTYIGLIMGERLYDISSKRKAPFFEADLYDYLICEECGVTAGNVLFKDGEAETALRVFLIEVEKMKRFGFNESEVQRAKDIIVNYFEHQAEEAGTRQNADFVDLLLNHFYDNKPYLEPAKELEIIKQMTEQLDAERLSQLAAEKITDENLIVLYNGPARKNSVIPTEDQIRAVISAAKNAEIQANAEENFSRPLISEKLKGGKVESDEKTIYGATEWILKNGVKVIVLPTQHKQDQIDFYISKNGGKTLIADKDMPSFESTIWEYYLSYSGVSRFSGTTLSKMLAGKSVYVVPFLEWTKHGVSGQSTIKDIETALQLAYLYFTEPRFDKGEYEVAMEQIKAELPNLRDDPDFLFMKEQYRILYGETPRIVNLTEETFSKANLATLKRVYRDLFKDAAGATMTIVGNVDPESLKPLVEKYIGSLPEGRRSSDINAANIPSVRKGHIDESVSLKMETPKSTVIQLYSADVPVDTKKSVAMEAANYILDMVYNKSIREDEGGTYGVSTMLYIQKTPKMKLLGQVYFDTNPDAADKLRNIAINGMKELAENGPSQEEFNMAVENLKKKIPEYRISNSYWMSCLKEWVNYQINYDEEYEAAVNSLTPECIKSVIRELLSQGNMINITSFPAE